MAKNEGWELGKAVGHFRANSKALAEGEGDGIAKVLFNKATEKVRYPITSYYSYVISKK